MRHPQTSHEHHQHDHHDYWRSRPDDTDERGERGERGERRGRGRSRRGGPGGPGPWGAWGPGPGGHHGPPPWVAGFFGADLSGRSERGGPSGRRGGPRVRRGDVRHAILDVLREAAATEADVNGYQVIQQIAERSDGQWKPSPGSVYPTVQQLQDEGLVAVDEQRRRSLGLTEEGRTYVADHVDELAAVWAPFEAGETEGQADAGDLRPQIGQMMAAVWQVASAGTPAQREAAAAVLTDTRRKLYGILADGDQPAEAPDES